MAQNIGTKSIFSAKEKKKKKEKTFTTSRFSNHIFSICFLVHFFFLSNLLSNIIKHTVIFFFFFFFFVVMLICLQSIELVTSTNYESKSDIDMVVKIINYKIIEMVILFLTTLNLRINYNCGELIPS